MKAAARIQIIGICPIRGIRVSSFFGGLLVSRHPAATVAPIDVAGEVAQLRSALSEEDR
jgi:hypothetical protein